MENTQGTFSVGVAARGVDLPSSTVYKTVHAAVLPKQDQVPLHGNKDTVWCGMTASVLITPFFFEEQSTAGPTMTCIVSIAR